MLQPREARLCLSVCRWWRDMWEPVSARDVPNGTRPARWEILHTPCAGGEWAWSLKPVVCLRRWFPHVPAHESCRDVAPSDAESAGGVRRGVSLSRCLQCAPWMRPRRFFCSRNASSRGIQGCDGATSPCPQGRRGSPQDRVALFRISFWLSGAAGLVEQRGLHAGQKRTVSPNEEQLRGLETAPVSEGRAAAEARRP